MKKFLSLVNAPVVVFFLHACTTSKPIVESKSTGDSASTAKIGIVPVNKERMDTTSYRKGNINSVKNTLKIKTYPPLQKKGSGNKKDSEAKKPDF